MDESPTITISSILLIVKFASFKACFIGSLHFSNKFWHKCSKVDLFILISKSSPSAKPSISILLSKLTDKSFFNSSQATFNLLLALSWLLISIPFSCLNSSIQYLTNWLSKSSPPKWVLPLVAKTLKVLCSNFKIETSKVPPPKSKTKIFLEVLNLFYNP